MATTVVKLTKAELREMISKAVEQKLLELLGDSDEGLSLSESLRARLLRQKKAVAKGQRGEKFDAVVRRLRLK